MRHAEHDRLVEEVRSWYRTSFPKMGYHVERRRCGFYGRAAGRIVVDALTPGEIPEFLEDARRYFGDRSAEIWLENERDDRALGVGLVAAGCARQNATVYLAHVGSRPKPRAQSDVNIEPVHAETLTEFAIVRLKGFANSERQPSNEQIAREVAIRQAELKGAGRFLIARVGREPAAILAYYAGIDRLIFLLATRVPMRNRGVARDLLAHVVADAYDSGGRSVIINTDPQDTPSQWYRREGFDDEVYWHCRYALEPRRASNSR
jgi:GNAT superfamily N-acetyltransferase